MSEPMASGTDVPAARMVQPMTAGWMPNMQPSLDAHATMKYERIPIQSTDTPNVTMYRLFLPSSVQLGTVRVKMEVSGSAIAVVMMPPSSSSSSDFSPSGSTFVMPLLPSHFSIASMTIGLKAMKRT